MSLSHLTFMNTDLELNMSVEEDPKCSLSDDLQESETILPPEFSSSEETDTEQVDVSKTTLLKFN